MNSEVIDTTWGTELHPKYTMSVLSEKRVTKPNTGTITKKERNGTD